MYLRRQQGVWSALLLWGRICNILIIIMLLGPFSSCGAAAMLVRPPRTSTTAAVGRFLAPKRFYASRSSSQQEDTGSNNTNNLPRLYVDELPSRPTVITSLKDLSTATSARIRTTTTTPESTLLSHERIVSLSPDQSHYVSTVLRLTKSHKQQRRPLVRLFDHSGDEWLAELLLSSSEGGSKKRRRNDSSVMVATCQSRLRSLSTSATSTAAANCWLCVAPPKKKERLRWMVEKTTELGVAGYLWLDTAYGEAAAAQDKTIVPHSKLVAYAVEAAEQSERLTVPEFVTLRVGGAADADQKTSSNNSPQDSVDLMMNSSSSKEKEYMEMSKLEDFLETWSSEENNETKIRILVCRERSNTLPIWTALQKIYTKSPSDIDTTPNVAFLIGPEGGWSPEENERMDALERSHPELFWNVSLGPTILRAETAAMTAVAAFTLHQNTT